MRVRKLLSSILAICMLLSTMGTVAFANGTVDTWDGTADTSWYNEADSEFTITTAEQLAGLAELVNGGNSFNGKTIKLTADLDLSNYAWTPIGTSIYDKSPETPDVKMFAGNFDGGNHTITGLTSEGYVPAASETTSTEYSFALFGFVYAANISNVKLADVNIDGGTRFDSDGNSVAGSGVAALIGYYYVKNEKECVIENCHVLSGTVKASNNMGGLIGFLDSQKTTPQKVNITIENCSNAADVTSEAREAGGILGLLNASRDDYTPTMAGSIAFKNCTNAGDITTLDGGGVAIAGGILGKDQNEYSNQQLKIIFDGCTNSGTITVHASGETHASGLGTSFYSHGTWLVAKNSSNTGDIVVLNPENCGGESIYAGGLFAYAGVMDVMNSTSTGSVKVGEEVGNTYVGGVSHILFLDEISDFKDTIGGYTYYLNGGYSPEFPALVDDVSNWGGNFTVLVKTARLEGSRFDGWYDNPGFDGEVCTTLVPGVKTYYAKWTEYVAKIDETAYVTLQDAIADAQDGDTIKILAGEYDAFTVPADKNNLTFVGETGSNGLSRSVENLVTIKTLEEGIETHNGGVFVQAETTTFKNLNFTAGTVNGAKSGWMSSSIGNTNGDTGMRSSLKNLVIENCNFTGSGVQQAIWTNHGNITFKDSTITNYSKGIDNYAIGADQKVVIENSVITDVYNAFHTGEAKDGSKIVVTGTEIDSDVIDFGGAVAVNVEESTIKNAKVTTYASSTLNISESALYDTTYAIYEGATGSITLDSNYVNNVNEVAENAKTENITFSTYYPTYEDFVAKTGLTGVPAITDSIRVKFVDVTDANAEGEKVYNINLVATDDEIINRLNSADLTFAFNPVEGDVAYEIIVSNGEVAINPVDNSKVRYEFHYNGKTGVTTDSANTITIGQVRFEGYGKFDFTVDATVDTNAAHATTVADNIVDTFIPNGNVANGEGILDVSDNTITNVVIAVPDRNLAITIDFPNAIIDNVIAYQDMKVVISGGDLVEDITIDLGTDAVATELDIFGKVDAAFVAEMVDGSYVINVTDALTLNNAYTVTVSGAGYRTARYTVTMTEDKALRFWNNVMDEAQVVEIGKDSSAVNVTFLAGDIVKDNKINIYDLSAVVSYFGQTNNTSAYSSYAKYDLNRDGVIDSKDVAYVLVSWDN